MPFAKETGDEAMRRFMKGDGDNCGDHQMDAK